MSDYWFGDLGLLTYITILLFVLSVPTGLASKTGELIEEYLAKRQRDSYLRSQKIHEDWLREYLASKDHTPE